MAVNRGKDFEFRIRTAFESVPDVSIDRLIDPQSGYAGVRNICDFIVYRKPFEYYIECKSCHGTSLSFSNITDNQWTGLLEKSKITGVVAGYMIWFIDLDVTMFASARLLKFIKDIGRKSINPYTFVEGLPLSLMNDFYFIKGVKRRVLYDYDLEEFLDEVPNGKKM